MTFQIDGEVSSVSKGSQVNEGTPDKPRIVQYLGVNVTTRNNSSINLMMPETKYDELKIKPGLKLKITVDLA